MKKDFILFTCLLGLALPATATAADAKPDKIKAKGQDRPVASQQVLKRFDANGDGKIAGGEADALRQAFTGARQGAMKAFDTNNNGKLDDTEIAAIHGDQTAKKGKREGKKGARADRPAAPQQALRKFDANGDGKIDGTEAAALRKAFDGPNHAAVATFDTNKDGKLDDTEIAAIHGDQPARKRKAQ
jgi:Ca2+-binding EF-hand superfamily protein